jgi:hypothetical protein
LFGYENLILIILGGIVFIGLVIGIFFLIRYLKNREKDSDTSSSLYISEDEVVPDSKKPKTKKRKLTSIRTIYNNFMKSNYFVT